MKSNHIILQPFCIVAFAIFVLASRTGYGQGEAQATPPVDAPRPLPVEQILTGDGPLVVVPPRADGSPEAGAEGASLGNRGFFGAPVDVSDEEAQRLIDEYKRQAGEVGPRKIFSNYKVSPHFGVGAVYDDNILSTPNQKKESDEITTLSGGVSLLLGDFKLRHDTYLIFDYTAAGELFYEHDEEDALNQDALLEAQYHWHQLVTHLSSRFQSLHDSTADFGTRTRRYVYDEALSFRYERNDRSAFQSALAVSYSDYASPVDIFEAALNNSFDWQIVDKVRAGAGVVVGRLEATGEVGEYYEQALARFNYEVTDKVLVQLQVGAEFRQGKSDSGEKIIPVFDLTGRWTPLGGTSLTLDAFRHVQASASQSGEDFIDTGFRMGLRQRLIRRFYLQFDASFDHADYENVTDASLPSRTDNYYLLRGALGYDFVDWCKTQVFYQRRQDDSTRELYSFESNRVGVQLDLSY